MIINLYRYSGVEVDDNVWHLSQKSIKIVLLHLKRMQRMRASFMSHEILHDYVETITVKKKIPAKCRLCSATSRNQYPMMSCLMPIK
jgi:hypothetical protein